MSGGNTMRLGDEISGLKSLNLRDLMKEQDRDEIKEGINEEEVSERQRQTMGSILGGLISANGDQEEEVVTRTTLWEVIQSEQSEKPKEITNGRILKNVMRLVARKKEEIRVEEEEELEEESSRLLQSWGSNRSPRSPVVVDSARATIDSERLEEEEGERLDGAVRVFVVGGSSHAAARQIMDRPRWRGLRQKLRLRKFACCGSTWSAERSNLSSATPIVLQERDDDDEISWSGSDRRIDSVLLQNNNGSSTSAATDESETCVTTGTEASEAPTTFGTRINSGSSYHPDTDRQTGSAEIPTAFGTSFNLSSYHPEVDRQTEGADTSISLRTIVDYSSSYHPETNGHTQMPALPPASGNRLNLYSSETNGQTQRVNQVLEQPGRERRQQLLTLLDRAFEPAAADGQEIRGSMNLAAALAAERQLRATQEREPIPSARVSTSGDQAESLTEFQTEIERRGSRSPFRVSLMSLLEEADDGTGSGTGQALEEWDSKQDLAAAYGGGIDDSLCCVCMVRRKGAAFIPCGHTFCRLCTRELWVSRGSCPLCNRCIMEILDIF